MHETEDNVDIRRERIEATGLTKWFGLVFWILICFGAAASGAFFPPDEWYANLNRPSIAPPNAVFGPVWTTLYLCMAIAAWLVWRQKTAQGNRLALFAFLFQLLLNAAWTCFFFGYHRIDWALYDIVLLLVVIVTTVFLFFRKSDVAGWLLVPYFAWVAFATVLNFEYWRLNR